jgi:hypothetical protein
MSGAIECIKCRADTWRQSVITCSALRRTGIPRGDARPNQHCPDQSPLRYAQAARHGPRATTHSRIGDIPNATCEND